MSTMTLNGFSKLSKEEKLKRIATTFQNPIDGEQELKSFWHSDIKLQEKIDEFSENTISNFILPFSVSPNFVINGKNYTIPMVIEESSVVAANAKAAKYWQARGGFHAEVKDMEKIGQVHFIWHGDKKKLVDNFSSLKEILIAETKPMTVNMEKRGGGITNIELVDMTEKEPGYYQIKAGFKTADAMGANFINSCLEEFAGILKDWFAAGEVWSAKEKECEVVMSILSNYTPNCIVKCWVECPIEDLGDMGGMSPEEYAKKFEMAIKIAHLDPHRATTHNKGIFNGIDATVLATGNDFRAVEACAHTYASRDGQYKSLTNVSVENGIFKFWIELPMAIGVVGGLTSLHPVVKRALEILGNPNAEELMMVIAASGLASNFAAVNALTTTGIQKGHMKMHLLNILSHFNATEPEKEAAVKYFETEKVSFSAVREFVDKQRLSEDILAL